MLRYLGGEIYEPFMGLKHKQIREIDWQRQLSFGARVLFFPFYFVLRQCSLLRFESGVVLWILVNLSLPGTERQRLLKEQIYQIKFY